MLKVMDFLDMFQEVRGCPRVPGGLPLRWQGAPGHQPGEQLALQCAESQLREN